MDKKQLKQAVLLVHGMGEQRPMGTIRDFVDAVFLKNGSREGSLRHIWIKPEPKFPIHELRRITTSPIASASDPDTEIRTDFFELYWQDLMRGSRLSHVVEWLRPLMFRRPWVMPKRLMPVWLMAWMVIPFTICVVLYAQTRLNSLQASLLLSVVAVGITYAWSILQTHVGDAARYFDQSPRNIGTRNEILNRGIDLLEKIQEDPVYDRVIVVGHSLGSAIAYDILSICWSRKKRQGVSDLTISDPTQSYPTQSYPTLDEPIRTLEHLLETETVSSDQLLEQKRRLSAWLGASEAGNPWKVTDFITLGSPLTHASVLLSHSQDELERRIAERYLPTDPPQTEKHPQIEGSSICYPDWNAESNSTTWRMHHAALFAAIRWSNLYVPSSWLIGGDLIGGPVGGHFGRWVFDVPVDGIGPFDPAAHVHYWQPGYREERLNALRDALDLERNTFPGPDKP